MEGVGNIFFSEGSKDGFRYKCKYRKVGIAEYNCRAPGIFRGFVMALSMQLGYQRNILVLIRIF
jgi:hypothetical protein